MSGSNIFVTFLVIIFFGFLFLYLMVIRIPTYATRDLCLGITDASSCAYYDCAKGEGELYQRICRFGGKSGWYDTSVYIFFEEEIDFRDTTNIPASFGE